MVSLVSWVCVGFAIKFLIQKKNIRGPLYWNARMFDTIAVVYPSWRNVRWPSVKLDTNYTKYWPIWNHVCKKSQCKVQCVFSCLFCSPRVKCTQQLEAQTTYSIRRMRCCSVQVRKFTIRNVDRPLCTMIFDLFAFSQMSSVCLCVCVRFDFFVSCVSCLSLFMVCAVDGQHVYVLRMCHV